MTLSSRARAFSVDNLLKTTSYKPDNDTGDEDVLHHAADNVHMLKYLKGADLASIHKIAKTQDLDKKDGFLEEECSQETANCTRADFDRYKKCRLTSENFIVQNNNGSTKENDKDNIEDEQVTAVGKSNFQINTSDAHRFLAQGTKLCSFPFVASGPAIDRNGQTTSSSSRSHFRASVPVTSTCFCHGEVTFCQHPGIISVLDNGGSNKSIIVKLCHADLWNSFHALGTEMIITKSGRRMFPALKVKFCGLDPDKLYSVKLEFLQPDSRKYRYIYHSSRWMVSGSGDIITTPQCHKAVEEPICGQMICSQIVSFERLKLTNMEPAKSGQVSLVSMQKFQPQLVVEEVREADLNDSSQPERYVIMFPQTSFMAVTAYQNHRITTLKIASNPFAKGFRESGKDRIPYESLLHPVSVFRKAEQDYLHRLLSPAVLPEFYPRDGPTTTIATKRRSEEIGIDSCTVPKMLKQMDNNPETTASRTETSNSHANVHSILYSELHSPLIIPSYLHPRRSSHQQQLIQELQHGQPNVVPSVSLYLQSMLHHSAYNSGILAQLSPRTLHDTPLQTIPLPSRVISMHPTPAHASFRPILTPTSNQPSVSPLIATIPSTSAAVHRFPHTGSFKLNDNGASVLERDLQQFPVPYSTETHRDQLSLVQQSRTMSLNAPMFSSSLDEQQVTSASVQCPASERASTSPGAFTPLCCLTDQAKFEESKRCTGCDYHALGKLYELGPGVSSLECRHPQ